MFEHTQEAFGNFVVHKIIDQQLNTGFSIVPGQGGIVLDIHFQGISILDGYQTPIELDINRWGKSVLLYPFPNRLKDGKYHWEGQDYQFPINDDGTDNALHGLGMTQAMSVAEVHTNGSYGSISCQYIDQGQHEYYPFPFSFTANFKISADQFEVELTLKNLGSKQSIPVGFGWHPYFSLDDRVDDTRLQFPALEMVGIDRRMIPTGKRYHYNAFSSPKTIGVTVLDNCFAILEQEAPFHLKLSGKKGYLDYWQETGTRKYQFVQLFTPPMRSSIAVEPMTCNVDAFNNQDGLIRLEGGETVSARFGIQFTPRS